MLTRALLTISALLAFAVSADAQAGESVYTDLDASKCRTITISEGPATYSAQECQGVAGYKLLVLEDDARQTITVVAPGGVRHPLDLWHTVSGAFSTVGQKAEWRVRRRGGKTEPFALIVRCNANEMPDHPEKFNSYLAVAKITAGKICVTDKIAPGPRAHVEARRAADGAARRPCLGMD